MAARSDIAGRHVLVVTTRFPPSHGGVQAAGSELAAMFADFGCRVTVATSTPQAESTLAWKVHVLPENGFSESAGRLARDLRPDLVLVNGLGRGQRFPFDTEIAQGLPVIYRAHGFNTNFQIHWRHPPFFGIPSLVRSFFTAVANDRLNAKLAQCVFLDDTTGIFRNFDILLAKRFHPGNTSFIPNAVPALERVGDGDFRAKYGIPATKPLFLCVANFCDRKGQVDAVKIILRHPELGAQFVFIGSESNETLAAVGRLATGDSRINVLCGISRTDVVSAINCCDAAFLFARQEQQPIFLIEAMSCGKPWFCTDVGSVSKMRGGTILRSRNESCFVKAVNELLSEDRRLALGAEGRAFWEANYSPDIVHDKWKRLLAETV